MKHSYILLALLTLSLSSAYASNPKPKRCPDIEAIKSIGLSEHAQDPDYDLYVAFQYHQYGTPETWFFGVGVPLTSASSSEDALKKAQKVLPNLSGNPIPISLKDDRWICVYNNFPNGFIAHAITPDQD